MPQACAKSLSQLGIRLEGSAYAPGDTIVGCVFRKSHIVTPGATVTISLFGRAKTKIVTRNANNHTVTHRGRFTLVPRNGRPQTIFQGPLHIEVNQDEQAWPFAITLPRYVDPRHLEGEAQDHSYLPVEARDHELPPTYTLPSSGRTEGFVEYVLEAHLRTSRQGHCDYYEARLPLSVINLDPNPPIADFGLIRSRNLRCIASYRLVPGMGDAKLSFSQKMKQSLGTSSVPDIRFSLDVDVPTVIQLDNPTPIPFKLRAVPDWTRTSEVIQDVPQNIKLVDVSLWLATQIDIICAGTFYSHTKYKTQEFNLGVSTALRKANRDMLIPCTSDAPSIDIGEMINLRVGPLSPGHTRLYPTFTTYNIKVTHRLRWSVTCQIADERFEASGAVHLKLIPPSDERRRPDENPLPVGDEEIAAVEARPSQQRSESWIRPPAEEEAPPSFAEAQKGKLKE
ncbi:hypothetical protein F66182_7971 [Fusarium sp. NRRL 66182]|nr:hypothetical protein F66182_7971 [Fusarium sp. NRRL 66182]